MSHFDKPSVGTLLASVVTLRRAKIDHERAAEVQLGFVCNAAPLGKPAAEPAGDLVNSIGPTKTAESSGVYMYLGLFVADVTSAP